MSSNVRILLLPVLTALTAEAAAALPPVGYTNRVVLCDSGNTHCVFPDTSSTRPAAFSGTISGGGVDFNGTAFADGSAGPGNLKASSSFTMSDVSNFFTQFQGDTEFSDIVTITSSSQADGSLGFLTLSFTVTGTTTDNGLASIGVGYVDSAGAGSIAQAECTSPDSDFGCWLPNSGIAVLEPIPFHYGAPLWLNFYFGAVLFPGGTATSGSAIYDGTARLSGMQVFDAAMNMIADPTFGSQANLAYTTNGVVPEPESVLLMAAGFGCLLAMRWRQGNRRVGR